MESLQSLMSLLHNRQVMIFAITKHGQLWTIVFHCEIVPYILELQFTHPLKPDTVLSSGAWQRTKFGHLYFAEIKNLVVLVLPGTAAS